MVVITLTDCPPTLRGDLTKWLQEIDTGVYVGNVNARVRDELWKRIRENARRGRAILVFDANNEQRMDFRVHNADWRPIDFDGIKLMLRPNPAHAEAQEGEITGFSNAAKSHKARQMSIRARGRMPILERYAVVDLETTGLSMLEHEIIEIGAIIVCDKQIEAEYCALVRPVALIPAQIEASTGLTNELLEREGKALSEALPALLEFVGGLTIVSHNADFDFSFLRTACERCGLPLLCNPYIDTVALARRVTDGIENYKLQALANHFGIETKGFHRSMADCLTTKQIYEKLIESG